MDRRSRLRDFFADLKRRKVYRAAIFYIVVAAGVVELADIVVPYTRLPGWTVGVVFAVAVFAFPLVLVAAWAFDVTPSGLERTGPVDDAVGTGDEARPGDEAGAAPTGVAKPAATDRPASAPAAAPVGEPAITGPERHPYSVAVLPFENLSGTDEAEPLAAGLHGDLLTALAKIPGLTVIARRSVMGYRGTAKRPAEIARELNVATLLEGAVQRAGGRVRLNVELIDPRQGTQRWAESYDRELSPENLFRIQTELTRRIAESLQAQLGGPDAGTAAPTTFGTRPARPPTADLEAYRLYSRGRSLLDHRTADAIGRALDAFGGAIERDPGYALAWAGLAEAVALLRWYDYPQPDDGPDPDRAAHRALELDPDLAEAFTSLGILHALRQDAPASRDALRRATELGPGYAEAQLWLAWILLVLDEPGAALGPARRALELNPHAPSVHVFTAETFLAAGRYAEARERSRRAVELQAGYGLALYMDALAAFHTGALDQAREALVRARALTAPGSTSPRPTQIDALLGLTRALADDAPAARAELETIRVDGTDPYAEGLVLAALGDVDAALDALARVDRWGPLATEELRFLFPRVLGPVRDDPRYPAIRRAVDRSWNIPV